VRSFRAIYYLDSWDESDAYTPEYKALWHDVINHTLDIARPPTPVVTRRPIESISLAQKLRTRSLKPEDKATVEGGYTEPFRALVE
jgi:hypothetical protein